jgi:glycosyltransferase involved in cell wall biosynthesis
VKILAVTNDLSWPARTGSHLRRAMVVSALATCGTLDLFSIVDDEASAGPSDELDVNRWTTSRRPGTRTGRIDRLSWLATGQLPLPLGLRDYRRLRTHLRDWVAGPYDVVWVERPEGFIAVDGLTTAPVVCDFDDLEDEKTAGRLRFDEDYRLTAGRLVHRPGLALQRATLAANVHRWRTLQKMISDRAAVVVVASERDRSRLNVPNGMVVENGYPTPHRPVGRITSGDPPTITMVGTLSYAPNRDAARVLVRDVLPRIRRQLPDARIRLVGRHDGQLDALASAPGVTLTGPVDDVEVELARADLTIVPLRFGSGTRVKILEAFAHRVPVVSTSVGAEGLDVRDGQQLRIADTPDGLAQACLDILADPELRSSLVEQAHQLWQRRYRAETVRGTIADVVRRVSAGESVRAPKAPEATEATES